MGLPPAPCFLRSAVITFSNSTQSGSSVRLAVCTSKAVRITASASLPASSSASASTPISLASQMAASTTVATWLRSSSSTWYSDKLRRLHLAKTGICSSLKPPRSFMPKWLFCGIAISVLSISEPPLERDKKELSRKDSAAISRSPLQLDSRYRLTRLTMRSRARSSSGRRNSVPK